MAKLPKALSENYPPNFFSFFSKAFEYLEKQISSNIYFLGKPKSKLKQILKTCWCTNTNKLRKSKTTAEKQIFFTKYIHQECTSKKFNTGDKYGRN